MPSAYPFSTSKTSSSSTAPPGKKYTTSSYYPPVPVTNMTGPIPFSTSKKVPMGQNGIKKRSSSAASSLIPFLPPLFLSFLVTTFILLNLDPTNPRVQVVMGTALSVTSYLGLVALRRTFDLDLEIVVECGFAGLLAAVTVLFVSSSRHLT